MNLQSDNQKLMFFSLKHKIILFMMVNQVYATIQLTLQEL
jgi:hypothetical protein